MKKGIPSFLLVVIFFLGISPGIQSGYSSEPSKDQPVLINLWVPPLPFLPSADPKPLGDFNSLTIPLKRAGRLFLIDAVIDGVSGNLVFDTGATGLVLNSTYFRNHRITDNFTSNGITGSTGKIGCTQVEKVEVGDLYYEDIKADVTDLGHIENRRGSKIIGLMGFNMIKSFEVVIDAALNELQLHRLNRKGDRIQQDEKELKQDYIQKIEPWHPVLILKGKIAGKQLSFCFDTGAETNAINSRAPKNIISTISITRRSDLRGAGQAGNEVLFGIMNDFALDNTVLKNMETIIVNLDALSEVYGVHIDGMLGFGFLEKGVVTINLEKKTVGIRFAKNTAS